MARGSLAVLVAMGVALAGAAQAAPGDLDPTFGDGGAVLFNFSGYNEICNLRGLVVQPDGRIIAFGSDGGDLGLARFEADGRFDTTFGDNGHVTKRFGSWGASAAAVDLQPDGKILVRGRVRGDGTGFIVRYDAAGSIDPSFGSGGVITIPPGGALFDTSGSGTAPVLAADSFPGRIMDTAGQSDGKIVGVGESGFDPSDFAVRRYNADGSIDASFGTNGTTITDFAGGKDWADAVVIQADGRIVAAGYATLDDDYSGFGLARYNSDGTLDASFGRGGLVSTALCNFDYATILALQSDGEILAAGIDPTCGSADYDRCAIARYEAGPYLVKDLAPGTCQYGVLPCNGNPSELTRVGDTVFFAATSPSGGSDLWRTDGTEAGTSRVAGFNDGGPAFLSQLTDVGGTLYFVVRAQPGIQYPADLWMSDGTAAGTVRVSDVTSLPSPLYASPSYRVELKPIPGGLLVASAGQLWRTDGTAAGTVRLVEFDEAQLSPDSVWLFEDLNGSTYFAVSYADGHGELWKTDGTPGGTVPTVTVGSNVGSDANPWFWLTGVYALKNVDGTLYFAPCERRADCQLWRTDGAQDGTSQITQMGMSVVDSEDKWSPPALAGLKGRVYFPGCIGWDCELWTSDGTVAGTHLFVDIDPDPNDSAFWVNMAPWFKDTPSGLLFNVIYGEDEDDQLWRTDGTETGTLRISPSIERDVWRYAAQPSPEEEFFVRIARGLRGEELWRTDGTPEGTRKLVGAASGLGWSPYWNSYSTFAVLGGRLIFGAADAQHGDELWAVPLDSVAAAQCGNGMLERGEDCDDGNLRAGDGCDAGCRIEPGVTTSTTTSSTTSTVSSSSTSTTPVRTTTSSASSTVSTSTSTSTTVLPACQPSTCDDGDPCTIDRCDPSRGCVSEPDPAPDAACLTERAAAALGCAPPRLAQRLLTQFQRAVGCIERCDDCRRSSRDAVFAFRATIQAGIRGEVLRPKCARQLRALVASPCALMRSSRPRR